jgi:hypothetical protein
VTGRAGRAGRGGAAGTEPALVPATSNGKPPSNREDHDPRLEYQWSVAEVFDACAVNPLAD